MACVLEQHIPEEFLPLAMEADRSTANDADEDLVLSVLAAVSICLEGTNSPIKLYPRKYEYGDTPKSHAELRK